MPTVSQLAEWCAAEIRKGKGDCHTQHPVIMEDVRKDAVKNTALKTRIGLETYSPESYSLWNQIIESLMEQLGCNPILVVDVLALLVKMAGEDGIKIAKDGLAKLVDYEQKLREAKTERKRRKHANNPSETA